MINRFMKTPRLFGQTLSVWLASLILTACSLFPPQYELPAAGKLDCSTEIALLDADIARYTHFDPALHRIPGQPLLRSNRFVASFASLSLQGQELRQWLQQMNTLAKDAYIIEFSRLPGNVQAEWQSRLAPASVDGLLNLCSDAFLGSADINASTLVGTTQPPANYSTAQRFWGIYPLTRRLAASRIATYRTEMTARIHQGGSQRFEQQSVYLPSTPNVRQTTQSIRQPDPINDTAKANAFAQHAPELWVEHKSDADKVGAPYWKENDDIGLNTDTPQAYTYISYTRYKTQILTQLNYVYWFSARPKYSWGDIYGGALDGVVWRVTLNSQGEPVLYDSIHSCGCYHVLFLPDGTHIDLGKIQDEKPLAFPLSLKGSSHTVHSTRTTPASQAAKSSQATHPILRLKLDAGTHYLIDVSEATGPSPETTTNTIQSSKNLQVYRYGLQAYQELLSLPASTGRRSLFGPDGIIAQSSRLERFVLWPLGVPNAGAMRQAGTHAIAFVGKRHFDDAWLLDQLGITITPAPSGP